MEGRHLEDSPETRQNLLATIQRSPDAIAVIRSETEAILDLGLTPDGKTLVASGIGDPSTLSKYDVTTRQREASITGANQVFSAVSPDGRHAVMSSWTDDSGRSCLRAPHRRHGDVQVIGHVARAPSTCRRHASRSAQTAGTSPP